jgi:hypothetical protein
MGDKITLELCSLSKQRVLEQREYEFDLCENHFSLRLRFKAEEPSQIDEEMPWIEVDNDFEMVYPRRKFAGIEKVWLQEDKRWKIVISIDGVGSDIKIYFKRQAECETVFKQLVDYFICSI